MLLATVRFRELAEATRKSRGVPDAPAVVLPPTEDTEYGDKDRMSAIADWALGEVLTMLLPAAAELGAR